MIHQQTSPGYVFFALMSIGFLLLLFCYGCASKPEPPIKPEPEYIGPKTRIAVMPFVVRAKDAPKEIGLGLSDMLVTALVETNRFIVVERDEMMRKEIIDWMARAEIGEVDPHESAKIGKILGARALIAGVVTELRETEKRIEPLVRVEGYIAMDIRIVDIETAAILSSHRSEGKASTTGLSGKQDRIEPGGASALSKAARQAIQDAVKYIVSQIKPKEWDGLIANVSGDQFYINAGEGTLKKDQLLDVSRRGEPIVDPVTGDILGYQTEQIGQIKVVNVQAKMSIASLISGSGVRKGDVVKFTKDAALDDESDASD